VGAAVIAGDRDKVMIDVLKSVGIERGKPFQPDAKREELLASCQSARKADPLLIRTP